jgi:hypothetical protein
MPDGHIMLLPRGASATPQPSSRREAFAMGLPVLPGGERAGGPERRIGPPRPVALGDRVAVTLGTGGGVTRPPRSRVRR